MKALKNKHLVMIILLLFFSGIIFLGCATTSQIQVLEEKTEQALEKAEHALKEAQSAKMAIEDSARYKDEAAASAWKAGNASVRAEMPPCELGKLPETQNFPLTKPKRWPKSARASMSGSQQNKSKRSHSSNGSQKKID